MTTTATAAERIEAHRAHLAALNARRVELEAELAEAERRRQVALQAGEDTREHARRCRDLAADVAAVGADEQVVLGWIAAAQVEIEREQLAGEYERLTAELAGARAALLEWGEAQPAAMAAAIDQVRAVAERLVNEVSRVRAIHGRAHSLHEALAAMARELGHDEPPAVVDPVDETVSGMHYLTTRPVFFAALRGLRGDVLHGLARLAGDDSL